MLESPAMRLTALRFVLAMVLSFLLPANMFAQRTNKGTRIGGWKLSNSKNIDGISIAMLELASDSLIFGHPVRLQIRCSDVQKPDAGKIWAWFVYEPDFVSENAKINPSVTIDMADIRTRIDMEPAAFLPNIHERKDRGLMIMDSTTFLSKLVKGKKLLMEFTPLDRSKQMASFSLRDIAIQFKRLPCS
jgi:hypothetical protein